MTKDSAENETHDSPLAARQVTATLDPYAEEPLEGRGLLVSLESLLKRPGRLLHALRGKTSKSVVLPLSVVACFCLTFYGVVVGGLSGGEQLWQAPAKIVLGTLASALICLPSLYVFLCLGGVDARFREVLGSLVAMVALSAVMLIGLAPVAWVFSQSTDSVALMSVMHLGFWGIATAMGARLLSRFLGSSGNRARLKGWIAIYLLVCVQMMTSLRPIVGRAETSLPTEKRFFLQHFMEMLGEDVNRDPGISARGR
ncbi:hypothetical protein IEN85_09005 [Pelagicoccus sp. NFK12]|uniref:YIP1 family protein n=1 Tax=Pelagicoccus enzymogenes TaxID=2773457 RepID=A0A927F9C4_9BACT|nr:hypothetical protein [Pelagicoccus enzymogenes]MBD5779631.1 hypothetical protein [Pelagicoccus enzymogenes]